MTLKQYGQWKKTCGCYVAFRRTGWGTGRKSVTPWRDKDRPGKHPSVVWNDTLMILWDDMDIYYPPIHSSGKQRRPPALLVPTKIPIRTMIPKQSSRPMLVKGIITTPRHQPLLPRGRRHPRKWPFGPPNDVRRCYGPLVVERRHYRWPRNIWRYPPNHCRSISTFNGNHSYPHWIRGR